MHARSGTSARIADVSFPTHDMQPRPWSTSSLLALATTTTPISFGTASVGASVAAGSTRGNLETRPSVPSASDRTTLRGCGGDGDGDAPLALTLTLAHAIGSENVAFLGLATDTGDRILVPFAAAADCPRTFARKPTFNRIRTGGREADTGTGTGTGTDTDTGLPVCAPLPTVLAAHRLFRWRSTSS